VGAGAPAPTGVRGAPSISSLRDSAAQWARQSPTRLLRSLHKRVYPLPAQTQAGSEKCWSMVARPKSDPATLALRPSDQAFGLKGLVHRRTAGDAFLKRCHRWPHQDPVARKLPAVADPTPANSWNSATVKGSTCTSRLANDGNNPWSPSTCNGCCWANFP